MVARYAVYFSPDDQSALGQYGQAILGRSAAEPRAADVPSSFADHARWRTLTQKPSHYGFHATLKAPFELASKSRLDDLTQACEALARQHAPLSLGTLAPRQICHFAALTLRERLPSVDRLANDCVKMLEPMRAPINEHDIQRRLGSGLSERQIKHLKLFGYPYVYDDFQFHMTLSDKLDDDDQDYLQWIRQEYKRCVKSQPWLDRIAIFAQIDRDSPFTRLEEFHLS